MPVSTEDSELTSEKPHDGVVREAPALALFARGSAGFLCERVELLDDGSLRARFRSAKDADWVEITVAPLGARGPVFRKLTRCQVRYTGNLVVRTEARKTEILALVLGIAQAVDGRLESQPGLTIAEALGRKRRSAPIVFGVKTVRELLGMDETSPHIAGFRLADVYPSSNVRGAERPLDIVLDFRRDEDERRALLLIGPKDDRVPAFLHTPHFSLRFLSAGLAEAEGVETLRAYIGFLLQIRDSPGMDVTFPSNVEETFEAPALPERTSEENAPDNETAALNLAIEAECGQKCSFCSVKETWPAFDGGAETLAALTSELSDKRRKGIRKLRLNGYDPLAFSMILEVLRFATDIGFSEVDVFSPCTLLADKGFCDAVLSVLPPKRRFYVPVYGASKEVHDSVVGVPGAFEKALSAIDYLLEKEGKNSVSLISVLVRKNLHHISDLLTFVRARGLVFSMHLPYPSFESRADRYYEAAARQADAVCAVRDAAGDAGDGRLLLLEGQAPCVTFRAMKDSGIVLQKWLRMPASKPLLPGTEYRDPKYQHKDEGSAFQARSIPCPHATGCALASVCPGEILRGYADLYGLHEFLPVSLAEIIKVVERPSIEKPPSRGETLISVPSVCERACQFCERSTTPIAERVRQGSDKEVETALAGLSGAVLFTGDDALSHPRIVEFVEAARRRTNLISLIGPPRKTKTASLAPALAKAGLHKYVTAILGSTAELHDQVAGEKGSFDALAEALLAMKSNGIRVELVVPLVRPLLSSLPDIFLKALDLLGADGPVPSLLAYVPDPVMPSSFDRMVPTWDECRSALKSLPSNVTLGLSVDGLPLCVLPDSLRARAARKLNRSDPHLKTVYPQEVCGGCSNRAVCTGIAETALRSVGIAGLFAL